MRTMTPVRPHRIWRGDYRIGDPVNAVGSSNHSIEPNFFSRFSLLRCLTNLICNRLDYINIDSARSGSILLILTSKKWSQMSAASNFLVLAGKLLYGEGRWQRPFAKALQLSQTYTNMLASGKRRITPEIRADIKRVLQSEARRLSKSAAEARALASEIKRDLQKRRKAS